MGIGKGTVSRRSTGALVSFERKTRAKRPTGTFPIGHSPSLDTDIVATERLVSGRPASNAGHTANHSAFGQIKN